MARVDEHGRKWLGDIPYDVWFDDPLATVGDLKQPAQSTPAGQATQNHPSPTTTSSAPTQAVDEKKPAPANSASSVDWERCAPIAVIDAETKSIRNHLTQNMQTVGTFNGTYKDIQTEGATLAALAEIVIEHSSPISWKDRAPQVRDLSAQIDEAAKALGREAYEATEKPYEQLIAVLDGGKAGEPATGAAQIDFAQRANRNGLMRRMNRSFTWLKQNIGKAEDLAAKTDEAGHEASMIAALAAVISHKSYDSAEEEVYRTQAAGMVEAAQQARKGVDTMNFAEFQESFNRVQKHCDQCHAEYRFGNE